MKNLIIFGLLLIPILNTFAADQSDSLTQIARLEATQSFGSQSAPALIRTLYSWDITSITDNIEPNTSSDGVARYAPEAVACATFALMLSQEKSKYIHNEIIQNELKRKGLHESQKQKLLTELNYINDYKYRIICAVAHTNLDKLADITGQDPSQLRNQIIETNENYSTKPSRRHNPEKILVLPE